MAGTSQNTAHYDVPLTDFAEAYVQGADRFIADKVFPLLPVDLASGQYAKFPRGAFFRDEVAVRPMGGRSRRVDLSVEWVPYIVEEESLEVAIDRRERANQTDPVDIERAKTEVLMAQHMIHRDRKWATEFFQTGVWGTEVAGIGAAPSASEDLYWNLDTAEPIKTVRARKRAVGEATGMEPNVLVLGSDVETALLDHPAIIERISGGATTSTPANATRDDLERAFGVRIVVATAVRNTAAEGAAESNDFIVSPKSALLAYAAPRVGINVATAGVTIAWRGLLGGAAAGVAVERWYDEGAKSDVIEAFTAHAPHLVASDLGVFFTAIVQ